MTQPTSKGERIEAFVEGLAAGHEGFSPFYLAYFRCFNMQDYYEAHDVLEHLWLKDAGENYAFYKGLIQMAGAFVHLKKQHMRPQHPKDGRRLAPAARLFALSAQNLSRYPTFYEGIEVAAAVQMCRDYESAIRGSSHRINPWSPENAPKLKEPIRG